MNSESGGTPEQVLSLWEGLGGGARQVRLVRRRSDGAVGDRQGFGTPPEGGRGGDEAAAVGATDALLPPDTDTDRDTDTNRPPALSAADAALADGMRRRAVLPTLEDVAVHWDRACLRAGRAVSALNAAYGQHPSVVAVVADGDLVVVVLRVVDLRAWYVWRSALHVRPEEVALCGESCVGTGVHDGVAVRLMGLCVPALLESQAASAAEPYRLWDQVYDLALPHLDNQGHEWRYHGTRAPDGIPLLSVTGRDERCRLTNVVGQMGPLVPVFPMPLGMPTQAGDGAL
ncbi:BN159_2729 family protein [Streptomyces sp. NPDC057253]|uniref:BN159_2729 family protein n=1 Tax=Streptomyces sp. NPDC057253 TaxID=3346069 RepID=UPI003630274D